MTQSHPMLDLAPNYRADLIRLLESRLLVTAASGSGKSYLLRLIIEQALPHVQVLIIDPEGEFHTLREKFENLLICAPADADAIANPDTAAILVRSLLETNVSAVFNIYDLKKYEREAFVRNFCEALVNAPRPLWHNVIIVIDEAHIFCPEGSRSEAGQAVIDLATRGRKRGFGLMLATQRLAKLHKDAAGEMLNKFIGRTSLINDIKRAADELGETQKEMSGKLKALDRGEWFAYGPALPDGIQRIKANPVATTHPQPGKRMHEAPPAPSAAIRKLLADRLKDLPQQAAQEAATVDQLRAQLEESREAVRRLTKQQGPPIQQGIPEAQVQARIQVATRTAMSEGFDIGVSAAMDKAKKLRQGLQDLLDSAHADMDDPNKTLAEMLKDTPEKTFLASMEAWPAVNGKGVVLAHKPVAHEHQAGGRIPIPSRPMEPRTTPTAIFDGISGPQQRILDTLALFDTYGLRPLTRTTLATQAGVSAKSSGFEKNLSTLRTAGLIDYPIRNSVAMTDVGRSIASIPARARTLLEFQEAWIGMVSGPQGTLLRNLIAIYPGAMDREALANKCGVSSASSGFEKNLSTLRTMEAIEYPQRGQVKASAILFPKGMK